MPRLHRWMNYGRAGECSFVTTTALNFARVLERSDMRSAMAALLRANCRHYNAVLHSYVVMPHHIHFVVGAPEEHDIRWFVQRVKTNSAKYFLPRLTASELAQLNPQTGLNGRCFWRKGFRSVVLGSEAQFWQKVNYTHLNPVRAGLCEAPDEYLWSSAGAWEQGLWAGEKGLLNPSGFDPGS